MRTQQKVLYKIWNKLQPFRWQILGLVTLNLFSALLEGGVIVTVALLVEQGTSASGTSLQEWVGKWTGSNSPTTGLLVLGGLGLGRVVFGYSSRLWVARVQTQIWLWLRQQVLVASHQMPLLDMKELGSGRWMNRYSVQVDGVVAYILSWLSLVELLVFCGILVPMLVTLSWPLAIAGAVIGLVAVVLSMLISRKISHYSRHRAVLEEKMSGLALDEFQGSSELRLYHRLAERLKNHTKLESAYLDLSLKFDSMRFLLKPLMMVVASVFLLALVIGFGQWQQVSHWLSAGALTGGALTIWRLYGRLQEFGQVVLGITEGEAEVANFISLFTSSEPKPTVTENRPSLRPQVVLENATFAYRGQQPVIKNLVREFPKGWTLVLGDNGVGKTTLVHLLAELYAPQTGAIKSFGTVGCVFEQSYLFQETVEWNITLGRDSDEKKLKQTTKTAEIDGFIESLPDGHQTRLGVAGVQISAGQRQRIALARALFDEPQILILDEATNALDPKIQADILQTLKNISERCILIFISHRPEVIPFSDRILQMNDGQLNDVSELEHWQSISHSVASIDDARVLIRRAEGARKAR